MLRDFLIYGVGAAASRLAAVFLVPLYTRVLSQSDYGQLEVLLAIHTLAVLAVGLQGESAVLRDFYLARDKGALPQLSWSGILIAALGSAVFIPLAFAAWAMGWLDEELVPFLPAVFGLSLLTQLFGIQLLLLRFSDSPLRFGILSFCDVALSALASVALITGAGWGIWGAIGGMVIGKGVCMLLAWPGTFGRLPSPRPSKTMLGRMLAYSLPTMPAALLNWLQTNGTRVLLAIFLPFADVAIASVGMRVAALFGFVVYSFRLAWEPWAFRALDNPDRDPEAYNRILQFYSLGMFVLAALALTVAPVLVAVFAPPEYRAATALVGFFVMGQYWTGVANITTIGVHGARVTSRLTWIFGAGAVANVTTMAALVPLVGVVAAAIAFPIGAGVTAGVAAWWSERHFATGFSVRLLAAFGAATFGLAATACWLFSANSPLGTAWPVSMSAAAAASVITCAFVLLTGFDGHDRRVLAASARTAWTKLKLPGRTAPIAEGKKP